MSQALRLILIVVFSYLLGSIPTSLIIGRVFFQKDVRTFGSGNAGATNAFRVLGTAAGIVTLAIDVGKGIAATVIVSRIGSPELFPGEAYALIAGSSAVIGHIWSLFARFRGGKGVGTAAGMLVSLYPIPFLVALFCFCIIVMLTGIVSAGSISAALSLPAIIWIFSLAKVAEYSTVSKVFCTSIGLLVLFTHRNNIKRLLAGAESRFPKIMFLRSSAFRDAITQRDSDDAPPTDSSGESE